MSDELEALKLKQQKLFLEARKREKAKQEALKLEAAKLDEGKCNQVSKTPKDVKKAKDTKPFRLLDLPPELWVYVCQLAIDNEKAAFVYDLPSPGKTYPGVCPPAITKVCKTLRAELVPYFHQTRIYMRLDDSASYWIRPYIQAMEAEKRKTVRGLVIALMPQSLDSWIAKLQTVWQVDLELEFLGIEAIFRDSATHRVKFL